MQFAIAFALLTSWNVSHESSFALFRMGKVGVPIVKPNEGVKALLRQIMPQLISDKPKVALELFERVTSIEKGIPHVRTVAKHISVATEHDGWFFYVTVPDYDPRHGPLFISGYAIKKGGVQVIEWSIW